MKIQLKTLSLSLFVGFAALLGVCTSANSSTPSTESSATSNFIELQKATKVSELENSRLETNEEMETTEEPASGLEATEETPDVQSTEESVSDMEETQPSTMETTDEMETTEDPASGLEATEETPDVQSTEDMEDSNMESNLSPIEETEESAQ